MLRNFLLKILYQTVKIFLLKQKKVSPELEEIFLKYKDKINSLYKQELYWHGSGRFQYVSGEENPIDILETIVKNNGLYPQKKIYYDKSIEWSRDTLSLSKIRMYAAVFTSMYRSDEKKILYLFGSRLFWLIIIITANFLYTPINIIYLTFRYSFSKGYKRMISFQSRVLKTEKIKKLKLFVFQYLYMPTITSDIKNNYPVLIAVKSKNVTIDKYEKSFDVFEARTKNIISFENISHIEVPFSSVSETQLLLDKNKKNIPVIPLEAAELYIQKSCSIKEMLTPLQN